MTALNPWQWYCSVRTFSNSLETTLTVAALNSWPWQLLRPAEAVKENLKAPGTTLDSINRYATSVDPSRNHADMPASGYPSSSQP